MTGTARSDDMDQLRDEAWKRALFAAGTAYIFEHRANALKRKIGVLTYAGVAVPLAVGATVIGYNTSLDYLPVVLGIAAGVGGLQLLVALWAIVTDWPGRYTHAVRSLIANESIAQRFEDLGRTPPTSVTAMRHQMDVAKATDQGQQNADLAQDISAKEKRRGMRAGLVRFGRRCAGCKIVPTTMKPTNCGVCGDF